MREAKSCIYIKRTSHKLVTKRNIGKDTFNFNEFSALALSRKSLDACWKARPKHLTNSCTTRNKMLKNDCKTKSKGANPVLMSHQENWLRNSIDVWVSCLDSPYKRIKIKSDTKVASLANLMTIWFGLPSGLLRLLHCKRILNKNKTVSAYHISCGSFICAELGLPGGTHREALAGCTSKTRCEIGIKSKGKSRESEHVFF